MPLFRLNKNCISHTYFNFKGNAEIFFDITLLQILLGRGSYIDFSSWLKFAKIGFYGAFPL
jgi:hypothetical protein